MIEFENVTAAIIVARERIAPRLALIAISGIDGSGKTYIAEKLKRYLEERGQRVALIHLDPWRTAPDVRYSTVNSGEHFYRHAYNFDALFENLIMPLKRTGSIELNAALLDRNGARVSQQYEIRNIDVILLEGIFLFKRELIGHYDLKIWIECLFETALRRALARNQEGKSIAALTEDYRTFYFPAQQFHLSADAARESADLIISNDGQIL